MTENEFHLFPSALTITSTIINIAQKLGGKVLSQPCKEYFNSHTLNIQYVIHYFAAFCDVTGWNDNNMLLYGKEWKSYFKLTSNPQIEVVNPDNRKVILWFWQCTGYQLGAY